MFKIKITVNTYEYQPDDHASIEILLPFVPRLNDSILLTLKQREDYANKIIKHKNPICYLHYYYGTDKNNIESRNYKFTKKQEENFDICDAEYVNGFYYVVETNEIVIMLGKNQVQENHY